MDSGTLSTIPSASQCRGPLALSLLSEDADGYQEEGDELLTGQWESRESLHSIQREGAITKAISR